MGKLKLALLRRVLRPTYRLGYLVGATRARLRRR